MARITTKPPTTPANSNMSVIPCCATGDTHARHTNHPTTKTPNPINTSKPPSVVRDRCRQYSGTATTTATPSATNEGPHVQQLNLGPSRTASQIDTTRKNDATTAMLLDQRPLTSPPCQAGRRVSSSAGC